LGGRRRPAWQIWSFSASLKRLLPHVLDAYQYATTDLILFGEPEDDDGQKCPETHGSWLTIPSAETR
jgi:hypothetical protein